MSTQTPNLETSVVNIIQYQLSYSPAIQAELPDRKVTEKGKARTCYKRQKDTEEIRSERTKGGNTIQPQRESPHKKSNSRESDIASQNEFKTKNISLISESRGHARMWFSNVSFLVSILHVNRNLHRERGPPHPRPERVYNQVNCATTVKC